MDHPVSDETREKIGQSGLGREPWNKGKIGVYSEDQLNRISKGTCQAMKGAVFPFDTGARISEGHRLSQKKGENRKPVPHGPDNGNWKGGSILDGWTYGQWRTLVFERDNYTCQMCEQRGGNLSVDHVIPKWQAIELIYDVSNGRTLCWQCHQQTSTFGNKPENRRSREYQLPLPMVVR